MASDIIQSVDRALEFLIYLYNEGKRDKCDTDCQ